MFRLTLGTVKASVANVLNLNSTDARVTDYINRSQERLLYSGHWVQTFPRYQVCVNNACLTWPRQIETIEAWAIDDQPGTVRNGWYEFLGTGPGILDSTDGSATQLIDRGDAVAFDDVVGTGKKLAVYCDVTESSTAAIILQFYDNNGNWVRTTSGSTYIDGESVTLPATGAYAYTTNECGPGGLIRVIKPVTNGTVRLYEYDTVDLTYRALAYYEPGETIPVYRRSIIPGLSCTTTDGACDYCTVTIVGKLRHIPATVDNDFLYIGHQDAIRLGCQAIKFEETNNPEEAVKYWSLAQKCLDDQLGHWQGAGVTIPLRFANADVFGFSGITVQ